MTERRWIGGVVLALLCACGHGDDTSKRHTGLGDSGRTDSGESDSADTSAAVAPTLPWTALVGFVGDECAVDSASLPWCWTDVDEPGTAAGRAATIAAPSVPLLEVSLGSWWGAGVDNDGAMYWWGYESLAAAPTGTYHNIQAGGPYDDGEPDTRVTPACALDEEGAVHCWSTEAEELWSESGPFTTISTNSGDLGAGLDDAGEVHCWGHDVDTVSDYYLTCADAPTGDGHTDVSCGGFYCCALDADGMATCWGLPGSADSPPPTAALEQLGSGRYETCGVEVGGAAAWCWGSELAGGYYGEYDFYEPAARYPAPNGLTLVSVVPTEGDTVQETGGKWWALTADGQIVDQDGNHPPVEN